MTLVKGQSGNPAGRRPGSRNKVSELVEGLAGERAEEMARKLLDEVSLGNPAAMRAYFDRIWPKRRGAPIAFELPPIRSCADVPAAIEAIIRGLAESELSPEEVESLTRSVERMAKSLQVPDADARLAAANARIAVLEAKLEALSRALRGRFVPVQAAPTATPNLAPAADLQAGLAAAMNLQAELAAAMDQQADLAPAADQQAPELASATDLQAELASAADQQAPKLASATNQQAHELASATDQQAPPAAAAPECSTPRPARDDWMRNFLGPEADVPWDGYPETRRRAA
jgi:hypothetical protein